MDEADAIIKEVTPCQITGNNKVKVCNQAIRKETGKCDVSTTHAWEIQNFYREKATWPAQNVTS